VISEATRDELRDFAQAGRLGSAVYIWCDDSCPDAGEEIYVQWDFSASAEEVGVLQIPGLDCITVPSVGRHKIRIGGETITISLAVGDQLCETLVEPRVIIPRIIGFRCSNRVDMGVPLRLAWSTVDAESCVLFVRDGERLVERVLGPAGDIQISFNNAGPQDVQLKAFGRHSHLSEEAVAVEVVSITVVPPPVVIEVPEKVKSAFIDEEVCFEWNVAGASCVRLEAPVRSEVYPVSLAGHLQVQAGAEEERFRLVATGFNGTEHTVKLRLIPRLFDLHHVPDELRLLNVLWEE